MLLYHFSEDPNIEVFVPRAPIARPEVEPLVWAIDEWHAPMYFMPRDCPRACFWPGLATTAADRERWFTGIDARMVIAVESTWLDPIRKTALYRYTLPHTSFVPNDLTAGHHVSRKRVVPVKVEPIGDLLTALSQSPIELRITPSLIDLWRQIIKSSLEYSGIRLRNARGYDPALFV
jgi:hypothetical protein